MRIAYLGTPEFAVPPLDAVEAAGHTLVAVVAQPDRPAGRGQLPRKPPVKAWAEEHRVPVLQPEKVRDGALCAALAALHPDVLCVAAYGRILGSDLLELAPFGAVNVHASLLPRWRGAAPIQWSIAQGDVETGVTIMQIDEGLDTGDILLQRVEAIRPDDDGRTLSERLALLGGSSLVEALALLEQGRIVPVRQEASKATRARPLEREDGRVDFKSPAKVILNRLRAFTPWPGAFTLCRGRLLKLLEAKPVSSASFQKDAEPGLAKVVAGEGLLVACGDRSELMLIRVQPEGNRPLAALDYLNGLRVRSLTLGT